MVTLRLATALRDAGLRWAPARGDHFVLPGKEMDEDVFVLADMTIEVHQFGQERVIGFNGTTEWALDSIEQQEALWLPTEAQLRDKLGGTFRRLVRDGAAYRVELEVNGRPVTAEHEDPAEAYGMALLELITGERAEAVRA